jgi:hypothetical protein
MLPSSDLFTVDCFPFCGANFKVYISVALKKQFHFLSQKYLPQKVDYQEVNNENIFYITWPMAKSCFHSTAIAKGSSTLNHRITFKDPRAKRIIGLGETTHQEHIFYKTNFCLFICL